MKRSRFQKTYNRLVVFVLVIFAISCQRHQTGAVSSVGRDSVSKVADSSIYAGYHPRIVDSLGLDSLYDEARWRVYCFSCYDTARLLQQYDGLAKRPFGFLNLKFTHIHRSGSDSIEFYFMFYYNDTIRCDNGSTSPSHSAVDGVGFFNKGKSVYYAGGDVLYFTQGDDPKDKLQHPLQPKVVSFITSNRDSLNPWFRNEAVKRGVLK